MRMWGRDRCPLSLLLDGAVRISEVRGWFRLKTFAIHRLFAAVRRSVVRCGMAVA
jgi:hypothetical protein